MTPIQFGLCLPTEFRDSSRLTTFMDDVNRALVLVMGYFDSAWMVDHLMFEDTHVLEGFTALTYISALHPQLRFGHAVLCQSFRNPALLAKMAATLQLMSSGRFILGLGAGWHEAKYHAYGYDFAPGHVRVEQLEEVVQIVRRLWTEKRVSFTGKHYCVHDAQFDPKPDPLPPLMIGAFRPRMLRLAAKYADWWNVSSTDINAYRRLNREFEQACEEVRRIPSTIRRTWIGGCACATTHQKAETLTAGRWRVDDPEDFGFVGTPQQIIEQLHPFIELGVDYFMFDCGGFPELTTLELLIDEVLPALNTYASSVDGR